MKIALCLYGYFNNRRDKNAGDKGYQYIKLNVLDKIKNVDTFIHSWEVDLKDMILKKYNPQKSVFENQIDFNQIAIDSGIDENWINRGFNRKGTTYQQCSIHASLSFYYSRWMAIKLKENYEEENNFKYDCVIVSRFDLGHTSTWHRGYNVSLMPFDSNLDMSFIYSAMWKQLNAGYADQWFFSDSKNIDLLGTMYEEALTNYFQKDSEYQSAIMNGWFDSNRVDQYSNEILKQEKAIFLYKYPRWQMINNHILHKWHIFKIGLYDKSKFI
jgi:hypothetical protein